MQIAKDFLTSTKAKLNSDNRIQAFVMMFGANLFFTVSQWLVVVILNINGNLEIVGQFGLATGMIAPIYVATTLSFRNLVSTDLQNRYTIGEYTAFRILTLILSFIIVCILGILSNNFLLLFSFALLRTVDIFNLFVYGIFERYEKNNIVAISLIIRAFTTVIGFYLGTRLSGELWVAIFIQFLFQALHSVFFEVPHAIKLLEINGEKIVIPNNLWFDSPIFSLLQLSLPVAFMLSLRSLGENFPRYIIERNLGFEALGIFTNLYYVLYLFNRMGMSFTQVMLPRMKHSFNLGYFGKIRGLIFGFAFSCLLLGLGVNFFLYVGLPEYIQKFIFNAILGSNNTEYKFLLGYFIIVITIKMTGHILSEFLISLHNISDLSIVATLATLGTILSSLFLIPRLGLVGSIFALGIGACIDIVLGLWFTLRKIPKALQTQ